MYHEFVVLCVPFPSSTIMLVSADDWCLSDRPCIISLWLKLV